MPNDAYEHMKMQLYVNKNAKIVIIFSMPSKVIIIVIDFMFLGKNIFWALLRAHFNPHLSARAKMSLSRAQNIFMPANINSIILLNVSNVQMFAS